MNTGLVRGRTAVSLLVAAGLLLAGVAAGADDSHVALRRFALVAGANNGGTERVALLYAQTDAAAMAKVLEHLGGVDPKDTVLLMEPGVDDLRGGFERLAWRMEKAKGSGQRLELLFYYSGHSDEKGLLMQGEHLTYKEVRGLLEEAPADVRIAILDSCASGALTRKKGGTWRAPFLVDRSATVKGHAFLTSSSADEAAQESDRIGASFFTHYMISGLRGAADMTGDNKVTLSEAYQYAFNETLARTEATRGGAQHPNYDFQLSGSGDLVLTDLRTTSALLVLPESLNGRVFLRDDKGRLVAEINKPAGRKVSCGLEPGDYTVNVEVSDQMRGGTLSLKKGAQTMLSLAALGIVEREATVARGDMVVLEGTRGPVVDIPFNLSFVPGVSINAKRKGKVLNNVSINILLEWGAYLHGVELSGLGAWRSDGVKGVQGAGVFNGVGGYMKGVQIAGTGNFVGGNMRGGQLSSAANIVNGRAVGVMGSGGANVVLKGLKGVQVVAGLNAVVERLDGVQFAAFGNYAGELSGVQFAVANVTGKMARGLQLGIANVNVDQARGLQAGLVNYSRKVKGLSIGLVNVASEMDGVPIGLINAIGNGILAPGMWYEDTSVTNFGLKMGSKTFYTILGLGWEPEGGDKERSVVILGLGGHIDLKRFWVDIDVVNHSVNSTQDIEDRVDTMPKVRVAVGFRLFDQVALVAGPTLGLLVSNQRDEVGFGYSFWSTTNDDGVNFSLQPGFIAGLQYEPHWGKLNQH